MRASLADQANQQLVDRLIAEGALWSPALIAAFRATPRHRFLDRVFQFERQKEAWREVITREPTAEELRILYSDRALITHLSPPAPGTPILPISSSSQPSLMAQMLQDLHLGPGLRVLEVGAGTGYNAALLAHVVGAGNVTSVDVDAEVLSEAWDHLRRVPDRGVRLHHADGRAGFPGGAPYDRIMVTAATPDLEPAWLEQLAEGGILLAPLALAPGLAFIVRGQVCSGVFDGRLTRAAYFMPLRAEGETGAGAVEALPGAGEFRTVRAPWAGWFDRRRCRPDWLTFIQSLAFYGWLRGLGIHHRATEPGVSVFAVADAAGAVCWLSPREWQINGPEARALGRLLWRAFLGAGGPWPTEYHLRAGPQGGLAAGSGEHYRRHGPRCEQVWGVCTDRERPVGI